MFYNDSVVVREYINDIGEVVSFSESTDYRDIKSSITTIPFVKHNQLNYCNILGFSADWACLIYIPLVIVVITAVSNGANITDGLFIYDKSSFVIYFRLIRQLKKLLAFLVI